MLLLNYYSLFIKNDVLSCFVRLTLTARLKKSAHLKNQVYFHMTQLIYNETLG